METFGIEHYIPKKMFELSEEQKSLLYLLPLKKCNPSVYALGLIGAVKANSKRFKGIVTAQMPYYEKAVMRLLKQEMN